MSFLGHSITQYKPGTNTSPETKFFAFLGDLGGTHESIPDFKQLKCVNSLTSGAKQIPTEK